MKKDRIVITGMGAVTPIGIGVPAYWQGLLDAAPGVSHITRFDASQLPVQIAAQVKGFDPAQFLPKKLVRETDIFMHFALAAAQEALQDSGCLTSTSPQRVGIVLGTSLSGITACSSGVDAIGLASALLQMGEADVVLAVGAESVLCAIMVSGLAQSRALSTRNDTPETACRPFDQTRDGFVIGEGGGALVLETEEHAKRREAEVKAELLGYSSNTDGYHVTSPDPEGVGAVFAMEKALAQAGLRPEQIGYVNAHGTSTKVGDEMETVAIKKVFGSFASQLPVSSTKGATGHLMGAGGITETIACIQAIREGMLPPTLNYQHPDPACDLDVIPNRARPAAIETAMSNAFGFGGQNASLIVGKYKI